MKIKKKIYIYRDSNTDEPFIFTSKVEAERQIEEDIQYDADRYHYSEEEIAECRKELEAYGDDEFYRGTYLSDHSFGYFTEEVEFEITQLELNALIRAEVDEFVKETKSI